MLVEGESVLCPEETTTVNLAVDASVPVGGGFGIAFYNPVLDDGINLTGVTLPYTFDNDLNGLLSANGFDLFEGEYEISGFVYTNPDDATGSICATSDAVVTVTFLSGDDPACQINDPCATENLVLTGDQEICPEETTTVDMILPATVPNGGGFGVQFYNPVLDDGINLSGVTLPFTFDNDLNGLLSANGFDLFEGEYELTGYVYTDEDNPNTTVCATSDAVVNVTFLSADDPACIVGIGAEYKGPDFTIFPNPASHLVSIRIDVSELNNLDIRLTDMSGRTIFATNDFVVAEKNLLQLNTAKLSEGVYLIMLISDNETGLKKLVISR